ncbi:MAG: hypothetical protein IPG52_03880 [Rhodocyclaceae bacterium]|nr:hypothetical protein [Rhodocyclaceae bacterium]
MLNDPLPKTLPENMDAIIRQLEQCAIRIARQQLAIELLPANDGRRVGVYIPKVFDTNQHKG